MAYDKVKASAPGSSMLFGEHAVLDNYMAICMALNTYMHVEVIPRADDIIHISSPALGEYQTSITQIAAQAPFQFVLTTLAHYQPWLTHGLNIHIYTEFCHTKGFGSSAAVTVALVAALEYLLLSQQSLHPIFMTSKQIIQTVQGHGSGADALASTFGGIVCYQQSPLYYEKLNQMLSINLIYAGYKTPTPEVIAKVLQLKAARPEYVQTIFKAMDTITRQAREALINDDIQSLGALMYQHQHQQVALGVSDTMLDDIIINLQQQGCIGAKISGSGLGDCVVALGEVSSNRDTIQIDTAIQGVSIHVT